MTTTEPEQDRLTEAIEQLIEDLFDGRPTISRDALADGLGLGMDPLKQAQAAGELTVVRVSPRRFVVTRASVRRYLTAMRERPPIISPAHLPRG